MPAVEPDKPLPLVPYKTLMGTSVEPVPWLVEPLIAVGDRVMLYGEWGAYKSWGLASLALHLAAGRPWLGKFQIPGPQRVLYIDEEMSERLFRRRLRRLAAGMRLEDADLPLMLLSRYGVRTDERGVKTLLRKLKEADFDPDVLIFETFRRVFLGDENSAQEIGAFWLALTPLLQPGKTIFISHHMRKPSPNGGSQTRDRFRGSSDILAGADSALAFSRKAKEGFVVEHVKCRYAEEADPFGVSFFEVDAEGPVELMYEGTPADWARQGGKIAQAEQLIRVFLQSGADRAAKTEDLLAHLGTQGISKTTGERTLKDLKKRGTLDQPGGRGVYRLVRQSDAN